MSPGSYLRTTLVLIWLSTLFACTSPQKPTPTPLTMQLQWTHQAEFAGFYAAEANQYYADEGLAVTLVEGGPDVDNIAPVVNGRAQFSIGSGEQLILARAAGKSLRAVATIYRRSPTVFFSLASSGITRPQDFAGKTIRTPANMAATLHAMTARVGVAPN